MSSAADTPLVRIVDDSASLTDSLSFMLACEGYETQAYQDPRQFLAELDDGRSGCCILDIRMPGLSGLDVQQAMLERRSPLPIIFLTGHGDIDMAVEAMQKGAFDFRTKPVDSESFLQSVARAVTRDRELRAGLGDVREDLARAESLTEREEQVLRMVGEGATSRVVAERLGLAKKTVDGFRQSGAGKIGLKTPSEIALFFARLDAWKKSRGML